ncbi:Mth938-like domain-containing protein [Rhodoferax aquaticus]|uniref:Xcc1710-like domain-containing protein n=1 Tax=Rhodoferax aquaticus TaxID=2527691 RepID=A0A515ENH3_9BURK|nr:Mth938-like domain-containing protein [Rhodoferax aquaticus]QDL54213.1 hypothetical protein EXZ61_08565 [Rhodoferax aquaticus]
MKLQPDAIQGPSITAYGSGWVAVNGEQYHSSIIISAATGCQAWDCNSFDALTPHHFEQLAMMDAEMILFGSGATIRFARPVWLQALYAKRIGVETMDTQAACRTYNFLASEGRKVVAALLL